MAADCINACVHRLRPQNTCILCGDPILGLISLGEDCHGYLYCFLFNNNLYL